jgi:O-antigen ligase
MVPAMTPSLPKRFEPLISRFVHSVIRDASITWENFILVASIVLLPLFYLTVKNWTETFLVILAVISSYSIWKSRLTLKSLFPDRATSWIFASLSFPIVAVVLSILIRGDLHWRLLSQNVDLLNGPSRLFLAAVAFLWMRHRGVQFLTVFNIACGLSILLTLPFAHTMQPGIPDRYTTSIMDLDEFSQQISLLGLIQILFLLFRPPLSRPLLLLNLVSILVAIKLAIGTGGRGGWIAFPPVIICAWILYRGNRKRLMTALIFMLVGFVVLVGFNPIFRDRFTSIYTSTEDWFHGKPGGGSGRLTMWTVSWQLIKQKPILGYGSKTYFWDPVYHLDPGSFLRKGVRYEDEAKYLYVLCDTGEHNQYLADYLLIGPLGFISRCLLLGIPFLILLRIRNQSEISYEAGSVGVGMILAFAIFGITQGPFAYKLVTSFYGFAVAGFAASSINSRIRNSPF